MPDIPTEDQHATHLGWQRGDNDSQDDRDHLVIDGSFGQQPSTDTTPLISFDPPPEETKQPLDASNQPSFLNVDSQGLESPLEVLGCEETLDDPAEPALVWFGDASDADASLDSSDPLVFS